MVKQTNDEVRVEVVKEHQLNVVNGLGGGKSIDTQSDYSIFD